jgi:heme-degrading monooxygenase HmoA
MFSVQFEVHPKQDQFDAYLGYAKLLKAELEEIDGFVDNIRYASLTRDGWLLSLSNWRDEKALVRWRTHAHHHEVQAKGRFEVFVDYHLRVGQLTVDTRLPEGCELSEQRFDLTEAGDGDTVVLIDAPRTEEAAQDATPAQLARWLGLGPDAYGLTFWDVYDAVLKPGDLILQTAWQDETAARAFEASVSLPDDGRLRRVRIVRDYGMYDRRETPQYYAEVR